MVAALQMGDAVAEALYNQRVDSACKPVID